MGIVMEEEVVGMGEVVAMGVGTVEEVTEQEEDTAVAAWEEGKETWTLFNCKSQISSTSCPSRRIFM